MTSISAEQIARALGRGDERKQPDGSWTCYCPVHEAEGPHHPSLSVTQGDKGFPIWVCRSQHCDQGEILEAMQAMGILPKKSEVTAEFDYTYEQNEHAFQVQRLEPGRNGEKKSFIQRHRGPDGRWHNGLGGKRAKTKCPCHPNQQVRVVLFHLPELHTKLAERNADGTRKFILINEGEKHVLACEKIGIGATTAPMGASAPWRKEWNELFRGAHLALVEDFDAAGRLRTADTGRNLHGVAAVLKVLRLPDLPEKGDIIDWLEAHAHREIADEAARAKAIRAELAPLIKAAPEFDPAEYAAELAQLNGKKPKAAKQMNLNGGPPHREPRDESKAEPGAKPYRAPRVKAAAVDGEHDSGRIDRQDFAKIEELHEELWAEAEKKASEAEVNRKSSDPIPEGEDFLPPFYASDLEEIIVDRFGHRFARNMGQELYRHRNGVYQTKGDNYIRRLVKAIIIPEHKWHSKTASETVERILVDSRYLWEEPPKVLNLKNGLLDISDPANPLLKPHSPDYLFPVQLPIEYDRDAKCPEWDKQIKATFPADCVDKKTAYEIVAEIISMDRSIQKALLLLGAGGTGKSTFLSALMTFLGRRNVSAMSLHKIEEDRFAAASLYGKLANICADLPSRHLETVAEFKKIVCGDAIQGEHKFLDQFMFRPYCRLLFSANDPPSSSDTDTGFFDKWDVLPLNRVYRGEKNERPRSEIDAKLADPSELSGVLNCALAVLPRVLKQNGLTVTQSMKDAHQSFVERTSPLKIWLEHATVEDISYFVPCDELIDAYNAYARKTGLRELTEKAFGGAIRKARPSTFRAQRTLPPAQSSLNGIPGSGKKKPERDWCYVGLRLKTADEQKQDEEIQRSEASPNGPEEELVSDDAKE